MQYVQIEIKKPLSYFDTYISKNCDTLLSAKGNVALLD